MELSNENVTQINKNNMSYLQFNILEKYADRINHAYSLGLENNFSTKNDDEELKKRNLKNYQDLCCTLGIEYKNLIKPIMNHTNNVKSVYNKINNSIFDMDECELDQIDGIITNKKGLVLATTSADCISILFYDPQKNVIANIHSGWKGTLGRISVNAVKKMKEEYLCELKDIICLICPSIRKCHFEVNKDVYDLFFKEFGDLKEIQQIISKKDGIEKWNIDTVLINKVILKEAGLKEENIIDSNICTVCNKEVLHSYRGEGKSFGLNVALIGLK